MWNYLVATSNNKYHQILGHLSGNRLAYRTRMPVTTHDISKMSKYVHFDIHKYGTLIYGLSEFLFVVHTTTVSKRLREK